MSATKSDFQNLSDTGSGVYLADQWPLLIRAIKALASEFSAKVSTGSEPDDILNGLMFGNSTVFKKWRIRVNTSNQDLVFEENTGTDNSPIWTQRLAIADGTTLDWANYTLKDGTRPFTGTVGGVTPVASSDLSTKGYVDSEKTKILNGTDDFTANIDIKNSVDATLRLGIDSGNTVGQPADVAFIDRGNLKFTIRKTAANILQILNSASQTIIDFADSKDVTVASKLLVGTMDIRYPHRTYKQLTQATNPFNSAGTETAVAPPSGDTFSGVPLPSADGTKRYRVTCHLICTGIGGNSVYTIKIRVNTAGDLLSGLVYTSAFQMYTTTPEVRTFTIDIPAATAVTNSKLSVSVTSSAGGSGYADVNSNLEIIELLTQA